MLISSILDTIFATGSGVGSGVGSTPFSVTTYLPSATFVILYISVSIQFGYSTVGSAANCPPFIDISVADEFVDFVFPIADLNVPSLIFITGDAIISLVSASID